MITSDASKRIIRKEKDGYHVYSEDGKKHLGGPYKTEEEAKKRLGQIDYFKAKGEKMAVLTPEKRFLTLEKAEIRAQKGEKGTVLTGYAAKFDRLSQDLGGFVEKIDKKAFERCLQRCDVRALKNHDPAMLLGRTKSGTMELSTDDEGLRYVITLPDTQIGRDLVTEIERGDIDGSSFSFTTEPDGDSWDDSTDPPTRTLMNIRDLFDVGPVVYPAYLDTEASMASLRSLSRFQENRKKVEWDAWEAVKARRLRILKMRSALGIS